MGFPPNVLKWYALLIVCAISGVVMTAASGNPLPIPLAVVTVTQTRHLKKKEKCVHVLKYVWHCLTFVFWQESRSARRWWSWRSHQWESNPPENCHLNVRKLPKTWNFFQKNWKKLSFSTKLPLANFLKKLKIFFQFYWKKCQFFGNFLTFNWQFSGGSE